MKKVITLSLLVAFISQGCYTLNYGGKKPFFLVDAPAGLSVSDNKKKEKLVIDEYPAYRYERTTGNTKTTVYYNYPGFLLKVKKKNEILMQVGDRSMVAPIQGKAGVGMLIFEGIFTVCIGTIVDLATGSFYYSKYRFIDVAAYMNGTKPRSQKELKKYVRSLFEDNRGTNQYKGK